MSYSETLRRRSTDRLELEEARQTLQAIRDGEVDAVVVSGARGPQVYTLEGPDRPFRTFVESMEQGAISLAADGTILYCNASFADLLKTPLERVIGAKLIAFVAPEDARTLRNATQKGRSDAARCVVKLVASGGVAIPSSLTITHLAGSSPPTWCVVVSELATKELAREAQHAREKAEAANAAKDDFLALLSHELRGPSMPSWAGPRFSCASTPTTPSSKKGSRTSRGTPGARRASSAISRTPPASHRES